MPADQESDLRLDGAHAGSIDGPFNGYLEWPHTGRIVVGPGFVQLSANVFSGTQWMMFDLIRLRFYTCGSHLAGARVVQSGFCQHTHIFS